LIGVEKKLHRGSLVTKCKFAFSLGFNRLREFDPAIFPTNHVAGFKLFAQPTDVEHIAAALLCLGD
jgi:hypothetical protein